jgi:hypothetical protein
MTKTVTKADYDRTLAELAELQQAYNICLGAGVATSMVLEDLAKFCRADQSCFDADPRIHAVLEGRREVWLRIQEYRTQKPEDILVKLNGPITVTVPATEEDNDA